MSPRWNTRRGNRKWGTLAAPNRATTLEQGARFGEHRLIGDVAAFALPGGVPAAGTRHASDEHVSRQQPVASRTAVRSCVHLCPPMQSTGSVDINNHNHHTGIPGTSDTGRLPDRYGLVSCRGRVVVLMPALPAVSQRTHEATSAASGVFCH
jgi:hypothetical protein